MHFNLVMSFCRQPYAIVMQDKEWLELEDLDAADLEDIDPDI